MKLQTKHITVKSRLLNPITVATGQVRPLTNSETQSVLTTDYVGNHVFEDGELKMTLFPGGYTRSRRQYVENLLCGSNCYYNQDYQGNNRDVVTAGGEFLQRTEYTPFGVSFPQTVGNAGVQPYKYSGKELDKMHGLNYYDFHKRFYDPLLASFLTIDPLCEKYYSISPYAYCLNNPLKYIDKDGRQARAVAKSARYVSNPSRVVKMYRAVKAFFWGTSAAVVYNHFVDGDKSQEVFEALMNAAATQSATQEAQAATPEQLREQAKRKSKSDAEDAKIVKKHNKNMKKNNADGSGNPKGGKPKGGKVGAAAIVVGGATRIIVELTNPDPSKDAAEAHQEKAEEKIEEKQEQQPQEPPKDPPKDPDREEPVN